MIDWARVNELRSEIGEDDFMEVVALFLEEADEVVGGLAGPLDAAIVEAKLHFLKGSALNLGLSVLAQLCQHGEKAAASGDALDVDLPQIADSYRQSKTQLLATLGQTAAA